MMTNLKKINILNEYFSEYMFYSMPSLQYLDEQFINEFFVMIYNNNNYESNIIDFNLKINNKLINKSDILKYLQTNEMKKLLNENIDWDDDLKSASQVLEGLFNCAIKYCLKSFDIIDCDIKLIYQYSIININIFIDINKEIIITLFDKGYKYKKTYKIDPVSMNVVNIVYECASLLDINSSKEDMKIYYQDNMNDIFSKPIFYCQRDNILSSEFLDFYNHAKTFFINNNKKICDYCLKEICDEAIVRFRNKKSLFHHNISVIPNGVENHIVKLLDKIISQTPIQLNDFIYSVGNDLIILSIDIKIEDIYNINELTNIFNITIYTIQNESIDNFAKYIKNMSTKFYLKFNTFEEIKMNISYYINYIKSNRKYLSTTGIILYENYEEELKKWHRKAVYYNVESFLRDNNV